MMTAVWTKQRQEKSVGKDYDRSSFRDYYSTYGGKLYGLAKTYLGNAEAAEEAVQSVFHKFFKCLLNGTEIRNPFFYLAGVLRNEVAANRRQHVQPLHGDETFARPAEHPAKHLSAIETNQKLWRAVESLDKDKQEVIALHLNLELTFDEIAALSGQHISTVQKRYYTAIEKLKTILKDLEHD